METVALFEHLSFGFLGEFDVFAPAETGRTRCENSSMTPSSGGVDSLACYLNRRDERPALFTIHGSDLSLDHDEGWQRIRDSVEGFSESEAVSFHAVKSNFREILLYSSLDHHFTADINRNWCGSIQYGTGLPSLCAPIAHMNGYEFIYQGSGYTTDPEYPTAQPSFVHTLRWGKTESRITEVEMSRQDKIEYLANNFQELNGSLTVRSCFNDTTGQNCSECEKCRRTILGLCTEGIDPNTVGYDVDQSTFESVRHDLEQGKMSLEGFRLYFWRDLRNRAREREHVHMANSDFYEWFQSVDLSKPTTADENKSQRDVSTPGLQNVLLNMPYPADTILWSVANSVKRKLPF